MGDTRRRSGTGGAPWAWAAGLLLACSASCGRDGEDTAHRREAPLAPSPSTRDVATPKPPKKTPKSAAPAVTQLAEPPAPPQQIDRSLGAFEGVLVDDETGQPLLDVVISHMPGTPPADESAWQAAKSYRSRSTGGEWGLPFLRDGAHAVRFEAVGYEDEVLTAEIPVPKDTWIEVRMKRGRWVHGHVRDAKDRPVPGVEVTWEPAKEPGSSGVRPKVTTTDQDGYYSFTRIEREQATITVKGMEGIVARAPSERVRVTPGEEEELDFTLPDLTELEIRVELTGFPMRTDYFATLTNRRGRMVVAEADPEDVVRFPYVEPGFYDLAIGRKNKDPWSVETVEVPETDEPVRWERTVRIPAPVHERVRPGRGRAGKAAGAQAGTERKARAGGGKRTGTGTGERRAKRKKGAGEPAPQDDGEQG